VLVKDISEGDRRKLTFLWFAGLAFLGLLIYSNILQAPFFFDDYSSIVDNETIKNLKASFADFSNNKYLTHITFAINYAFAGLRPFSYHLVNNIIHVINAVLVYYLVVFTFRTPQMLNSKLSPQFIAISSAFIFISHPVQTQAVTYIVQRSTSMATMFYLLSLVTYSKWRLIIDQKPTDKGRRSGFNYSNIMVYCISVVSAALAMKTKEIAFTLPIIAVLYEFSFFSKLSGSATGLGLAAGVSQNSNMRRFIYLFPILLTLLIIPLSMVSISASPVSSMSSEAVMQEVANLTRETADLTRTDYFFTQLRVITTYLRLLVFPVNQNFDYRYTVYHSFFDLPVLLSFFVILSIVGLSFYLFYLSRSAIYKAPSGRPHLKLMLLRFASFGMLWFFIALLVESSIIPIRDVIVEHRVYLPSVGFFIATTALADYFIKRSAIKRALIIFIVLALSLGAYSRNLLWKDPQKMWEDVVSKAPNNVRAYTELGAVFRDEGRYAEANAQFERALEINKIYPLTYYNLGDIQYKLGDYDEALKYFQKTLTCAPLLPQLYTDTLNSMGMTYSEMGDAVKAVSAFKEAIRRYPAVISSYNNLGRQYIKMGEADRAIEILEKATKIRETPHLYYNLSQAYALKGDSEKSRLLSQRAIQLRDSNIP